MREIKFRGKAWFGGEWHYGLLAKGTGDYTYIKNNHVGVRVDPDTIGQFTGICDKDGNEIYEGDVVEDSQLRYEVCWYDDLSAFIAEEIAAEYPWFLHDLYKPEVKIIGNVYDNPKLLKP